MYGHPNAKYPLPTGTVVLHKQGTRLEIVSGPEWGVSGERYKAKAPDGRVVPVLRENLRI